MTDYADRLAEMDEAYENVSDKPYDEGTYQGVIRRFDFFDSKRTGDVFLKTEIAFAHQPEYEGQEVEAIHNLTAPDKLKWTKRFLSIIGYDGPLSQIVTGALEPFVGLPVEFAIQYSDKKNDWGDYYMNVYVNRRLGELTGPSTDVPADTASFHTTPVDDSDIPF
jgi:hypothetical protein